MQSSLQMLLSPLAIAQELRYNTRSTSAMQTAPETMQCIAVRVEGKLIAGGFDTPWLFSKYSMFLATSPIPTLNIRSNYLI